MNTQRPIPLRPDRDAAAREWRRSFVDDATVNVLARMRKTSADEVRLELRSPVTPARVGDFPGKTVTLVMILAQDTALSEILDQATKVDLTGVAQLNLSVPTNFSQAMFIEEGFPIPLARGAFSGLLIDMIRKLALIAPITNELENYSAPTASVVIGQLLRISVGNGGAKVLLSADPATAAAPAGLLHGIAPLPAGASPADDINALIGAISAAGINTRSIFFVAAPEQASALSMQPWPNFKRKVIEANVLAPGTIIAIAADGFVVGGNGVPVVDVSKSATLHMSDTPAQIVAADGTVASPAVSMFQTDSFALRCVCRLTWAAAPGAVAWIDGATWGSAAATRHRTPASDLPERHDKERIAHG
ncbi:hypothetical protein [Bradyrhizobium sp. RDM4]|uniref:hypothetical protein n=1 Tax=Bradyrhizobium sp. RDM4 TaxID=3378765 RepID=UPI0038FD1350